MDKREANKKAQKVWYRKNKEYTLEKQRIRRLERRKWFKEEILSKSSCLECGENHPGCMDFHHRDPSQKEGHIGDMIWQKFSKERILKEIAKCDVLCANCHRKHHWNERLHEDV